MPLALAGIAFILSFPLVPQEVGPRMKYIQANMTGNCIQNARKKLLLISNYDFVLESCNTVSWFSSADFQMYFMHGMTEKSQGCSTSCHAMDGLQSHD